jgi:hypothetical protein
VLSASLAAASFALAWSATDGPVTAAAGFMYGLMGPLHAWNGYSLHKAVEKLEKTQDATIGEATEPKAL